VDCVPGQPAVPAPRPAPVIDYTARDYQSIRRALLERMALTVPRWVERHVPDLVVTLVELLAYTGDQLHYFLDAVATEAYLDTARRRVSVRRHARLVDYPMHDGCNARTWICITVKTSGAPPAAASDDAAAAGPGRPSKDAPDIDIPLELDLEDVY